MKEIITNIAKNLEPDTSKNSIVESVLEKIKDKTSEEVILGGSFAKQTHLGDSFDCDIFIRFAEKGDLSEKVELIVTEVTKDIGTSYERVHGSRDYFQFELSGIMFEIIPVLQIEDIDDAENIMDYSPFHVSWVKEKLEKKDYRLDIKVFKQFLKAQKVYGAESYIKGFSGHICDILIIYYNGFENTIKAISKWKTERKETIDIENFYKGKNVLFYMNESKAQSPIIIVDPIVKERNAAAALGESCYEKIISSAKTFIKNPSEEFFEIKALTKEDIENTYSGKEIVSVNIIPLTGKKDVVGSKMLKAIEFIVAKLEKNGFSEVTFEWEWQKDSAIAFIITKEVEVPKNYLQKGPEVTMTAAISAFKEQHENKEIIEKEGRLWVEQKRTHTTLQSTIKATFTDSYIIERVKSINLR